MILKGIVLCLKSHWYQVFKLNFLFSNIVISLFIVDNVDPRNELTKLEGWMDYVRLEVIQLKHIMISYIVSNAFNVT
jgi:hypothetical protein